MGNLTIGEVAKRAGVRTSAIRYYEDVGVLPPAGRRSGQRRYDEAVLDRLAVVHLAQESGFSVAEIRELVAGFEATGVATERWQELARRKLAELDGLMAKLQDMKLLLNESLRCGCVSLDACPWVVGNGRNSEMVVGEGRL